MSQNNHNVTNLREFLTKCRIVTDNYVEAWGEWSFDDQWEKIDEEDFEFRTATSRENELEEFWDRFFATLTLLHQKKYHDDEIFKAGNEKLTEIHRRSVEALLTKRRTSHES